jgi:putative hydrolase of the HAD superfamily
VDRVIETRSAADVTIDRTAIDAVVFDIGGVFTVRHHEAIRMIMGRAGFALPEGPEPYRRAHHVAVRAISDLLDEAGILREDDHGMWTHAERGYLHSLGVSEDRLDEAVQVLFDAIAETDVKDVWRQLLLDNVEGFHRIVASGMPVAVVSNNNGTAEEQLRLFGVCQVGPGPLPGITIVVDSTLVGVAKPDPAIFRPALEALGTAPANTLYVGDTVHADVHGATAAGMPVVQLDPYDLHTDFDHARLPNVGALADLLLDDRCLLPLGEIVPQGS